MWLRCVCEREWDYRGSQTVYATCPTCHSKLSIPKARRRYLDAKKLRREERIRDARRLRRVKRKSDAR